LRGGSEGGEEGRREKGMEWNGGEEGVERAERNEMSRTRENVKGSVLV